MQECKSTRKDGDKAAGTCCGEIGDRFPFPVIAEKASSNGKEQLPPWASGIAKTPAGEIFRVSSEWSRADFWGMIKSRTSGFRMKYAVPPGLYAIGEPTADSDVFVSANYKLSFDTLRRSLKGLNAWILVLDTKGINVWCAAGKGTFGTDELVKRISETGLDRVVTHRRIILPQLGALGVNASAVQRRTGFRVFFGPVDARDISAYMREGYKKSKEMSIIKFSMGDRLILAPMEINPAMKKFIWLAAGILLIFGLQPSGILFEPAWSKGVPFALLGILAVFSGGLVTPALLPFLPFRSFAMKGWIAGIVVVLIGAQMLGIAGRLGMLGLIVAYAFFPVLSSYLALQFTGATTFTGISGVKKELKIGIPIYMGTAGVSLMLMIVFKLKEWGIV